MPSRLVLFSRLVLIIGFQFINKKFVYSKGLGKTKVSSKHLIEHQIKGNYGLYGTLINFVYLCRKFPQKSLFVVNFEKYINFINWYYKEQQILKLEWFLETEMAYSFILLNVVLSQLVIKLPKFVIKKEGILQ